MNRVMMRSVTVGTAYGPLVAQRLIGSVTIRARATNTADVFFLGDDGSDVPWAPGTAHEFQSVDLGQIQVKGTAGDVVTIVGGTW